MYCERCSKTFSKDAKFCDICGDKLIEKINTKEMTRTKKRKKKKKKTLLIVILIITSLILVVGSTAFFGVSLFRYFERIGKIEYIELGVDKVPTIYTINNQVKIDYYNKESDFEEVNVEIEYYYDIKEHLLEKYVVLLKEEGFVYLDDYNEVFLVKESKDKDKLIFITIEKEYDEFDDVCYKITYEKEYGDISEYVKKVTYKRVGEEKFGFIDIESTMQPYMDANSIDMIHYSNSDNFLTLYYIENSNTNVREYMNQIYNSVSSEGAQDLKITEVIVDTYKAYQLSGYYKEKDTYIVIWCFLDKDNILHYIEMDSNDFDSEMFSKIESYSIIK